MGKDELKNALEQNYDFSLLNYASVIADVLAGDTILTRNVAGWRKIDFDARQEFLKREIKHIEEVLETKLFGWDPDIEERLRKISKAFKEIMDKYKTAVDTFVENFPMPYMQGRQRAFGKAYQIGILWASGLINKNDKPLWQEIATLFLFFVKFLKDTSYFKILELVETEYLKNLYYKLIKKYSLALKMFPKIYYFPFFGGKPHSPNVTETLRDKGMFARPIISISFYEKKITTVFESDKKQMKRETSFKGDRPYSIISNYLPKKGTESDLILEIT